MARRGMSGPGRRGGLLSVIINDLYVHRAIAALWPFKADAPFVVNSNAVLPLPVALQRFQAIPRQVQISNHEGRIELVELHFSLAAKGFELLDAFSLVKVL